MASVGTDVTTSLVVKKRNGQRVSFFQTRILKAIESAFKANLDLPQEAALDVETQEQVNQVSKGVVDWCDEQAKTKPVIFIEDIQDKVVEQLFAAGYDDIAEQYSIYRRVQERRRFETERLTVKKRDGKVVSFKPEKITNAIAKAFEAVQPADEPFSPETEQAIMDLGEQVIAKIRSLEAEVLTIHIEQIQDLVERVLMEAGFHEVVRKSILYREDRRKEAAEKPKEDSIVLKEQLIVKQPDGTLENLDLERLKLSIAVYCRGLEDRVSVDEIIKRSLANCFDGISVEQLQESNLLAARSLVERDPAYSFVTARILLKQIYQEVLEEEISLDQMGKGYSRAFEKAIRDGVANDRLNPALLEFDLERLGKAIIPVRDYQFAYMGLQTLYDRYFIHLDERRIEAPQTFWMRVAMGLAINEGEQKNDRAIEFYEVISSFRYVPSTPTLFNAGTLHSQLSSCFLTTVYDDLDHIFKSIKDNALLSKWSGGLGNDWTPVRALGSYIKGTNGQSQGVIPFLKVANDTAVAVNQGGKRQGAVCAYLEVWHMDVEEFLELRKNTGDDRRRTHDMHTANWIPDLFMKRVLANADWTLFSPNEVPELHDLAGEAFEKKYEEYEMRAEAGEIRQFKTISAVQLWRKMLTMLFETGHPWITFKDPSNLRSPQDHRGTVHSSNLCTEILLNTSDKETAVCNLGSVNLAAHTTSGGLDTERLANTVHAALRMLDNVIDLNFYPTPEAANSNQTHRPVGLGVMGFQDALYIQGLSYASPKAIDFADESMEFISYHAILASSQLAKERGAYGSYEGSKWDRGILPIDSIGVLSKERGSNLDMDTSARMDWTPVRESISKNGMRNSNTMAIAPTATIANITGVSQSIEPTYKNLYVKSNLSGEFTVANPYLVEELKALDLWNDEVINDIKYFDGALQEVEGIPQNLKDRFVTAFEMGYEWLIECASRRQKWIDMGQSLNLYLAEPSGKKLHEMYLMAWEKGLKTTYYLRSLGATRIEKSTLDANKYGDPLGRKEKEQSEEELKAMQCSIENGEDCEACQ